MAEPAVSNLTGPHNLVVHQASPFGPFRFRRQLVLKPVQFGVSNDGQKPSTIASCLSGYLQIAGAGTLVDATLTIAPSQSNRSIQPGGYTTLELRGTVPSRPGTYVTSARISSKEGATLSVPISIEIAAAAPWGIACMLFGLLCLALLNLLADESTVKSELRDALAARQAVHTWLEANAAPQSRSGDIEAMDREFDAAIASASGRRHISIVDRRAADAALHLKTANAIADQLRHDLAGKPRGSAEIADLHNDWSGLQGLLVQIANVGGPTPATSPGAPAPNLAGKLDQFLYRYRVRFLQQPVGWINGEMTSELDRVNLAYDAGEGEAARDLAISTRSWLRRAARAINTSMVGYRGALVQAGSMVLDDGTLRARIARPEFPAAARAAILTMLDNASAKMDGDAWLPQWAAARQEINAAKTAEVRASAEAAKDRFDAAIAATNQATNTDDIDRLVATLQAAPDHSPAAKQAGMLKVMALWQRHVAGVTDAADRDALQAAIDGLTSSVKAGDFKATGPVYKTLVDDWAAWNMKLIRDAGDRLDHQRCLDSFSDLQRDTSVIESSLRQRPPGPDLAGWDTRLDRIRLDMQRQGPDAETVSRDCMTPLLALNQRAIDLSGEILKATIIDLDVPALTRLRLARASGMIEAVAATQSDIDRARQLDLTLATPADERVVGRPLTFSIGHMDPVWGSGVAIGVTFGDGTPPLIATAEQIRQGRAITHRYTAASTMKPHVTAATAFKPGGIEPVDMALGDGGTTVLIAPSPISIAQALADEILNLRFAIALLIALVVYYWRFSNRKTVFGAQGFDYVEAFALGFAANAAVATLPDILAKLPTL